MRGRRLRSAGLALFVSLGLVLSGVLTGGESPQPARASTSLQAQLVSPPGVAVAPGVPFELTLTVTNPGTDTASSVSAAIRLTSQPLQTLSDASAWFRGDDVRRDPTDLVLIDVGDIPVGDSVTVSESVTLSQGDLPEGWLVYGVQADVDTNDTTVTARSALVWADADVPAKTGYVPVVPLVAPANPDEFLDALMLEKLTKPGGVLARQLSAAADASAVAVDPRIVASIVRLGEKAPATARSWLAQLNNVAVPTFSLQYGDADPALQGEVGFSQLLPISFAGLPALSEGALSAAWTPTLPNMVWAEPNTLTASGLTTILSRSTVGPSADAQSTAGPWLLSGSHNAAVAEGSRATITRDATERAPQTSVDTLVLNDELTSALRAAESATSDIAWAQSAIEASTYLAVMSSKGGGLLTAGFKRITTPETGAARTSETLAFLRDVSWATQVSLGGALDQEPLVTTLVETPESPDRIAGGSRILASFGQLQNFASASSQPDVVAGFADRSHAPLLSVAWMDDASSWSSALDALSLTTRSYINEVHFGLTSNINMVGGQASIPITVVNGHSFDVTVSVHAVPSNPRLSVGTDQLVTIPADSQGTVKIPVSARVGNGDVNLTLTMTSPTGEPVGDASVVPVSVRADWEGFGLVIMAVLFFALIITGTIRTLRRRRRGTIHS